MSIDVYNLPAYPPTQSRNSLSPSQLATLNNAVATSLLKTIALPPSKRDTPASRNFLSTFAKDTAFQTLQSLIWHTEKRLSNEDNVIRKRALILAGKLAISTNGIDLQTLVDLAIIYAHSNPSRCRSMFSDACTSKPDLAGDVENELVPAFTMLLDPAHSSGLYGLRKTAHCIISFLRVVPTELVRPFSHSGDFILALAKAYDSGLAEVAHAYGGLATLQRAHSRDLDDWERLWIECKVVFIDSFHILISAMVNDIAATSGPALASESERTFGIMFELLQVAPPPSGNITPTPFLNQPLLSDYQQSYDLSRTLDSALKNAAEKDARLDVLESSLNSLTSAPEKGKNPGVLKLILHSSGMAPGIDNPGAPRGIVKTVDKGKGKAAPINVEHRAELDILVTQVLDILPEHSPDYIYELLANPNYPFHGNAEKVIEALLEGAAPLPEDLVRPDQPDSNLQTLDEFDLYANQRRNVFDGETMDLSKLRIGKKTEDVIRDRTFIEQMKADILRRAEEMSDEDHENESDTGDDAGFDDEVDVHVKVGGDGEESGQEEDADAEPMQQSTDTTLELAYIRDPTLFDRDANTRRSKGRTELKALTSFSDEQIEGWRIMLERNPKKDKILQKHEFSGNKHIILPPRARGSGSSGRGRGEGAHRGRGGDDGGRGGGTDSTARDRARKDKNKASRGNHNRKRGHDKKMARAGGPPPS